MLHFLTEKSKNRGRNPAHCVLYCLVENFDNWSECEMQNDIQKASLWKRIAAGILDLILLAVIATGFCWALSAILNYDSFLEKSETIEARYMAEYGLQADMTTEKFAQMSPEVQAAYEERVADADAAIKADNEAIYTYGMVMNLSLIIATGGILLAMILLEFVVPMLLGNGQTVGKKVFGLCLIRNDGVKLNPMQLFTRVLLGRFTVETMIPVYAVVMAFVGTLNLFMIIMVAVLLLAEIIVIAVTRNNYLLHDLMAGTVVVDYGSQQIFKTTEDLIAHQKKIAAERAARQTY